MKDLEEIKEYIKQLNLFNKDVLTLKEAAKYAGLSTYTLKDKAKSGQLPFYKREKMLYFRLNELKSWMCEHRFASNTELKSKAHLRKMAM